MNSILLKFFHVFLLPCMLFGTLYAQTDPASFIHITGTPHRFAQKEVKDILQDPDGFMWIGTTYGLFRYDGHDMRLYQQNPLDPTSLGGNFIKCLEIGADSSIWVGTLGAGLFRYDRYSDTFVHVPMTVDEKNRSYANDVNDLLLDSQKRLWVATNAGLGLVDQESKHINAIRYTETDSIGITDITCLIEDDEQNIWAGVGELTGGFYIIHPQTQKHIRFIPPTDQEGSNNKRVIALAKDVHGYVWFSTEDTRLHRLEPVSGQIKTYNFFSDLKETDSDIQAANIWAIEPDDQGNLWLGTHTRGLIHFSPTSGQRLHYYENPLFDNSIASDAITTLFLDSIGLLWIGYAGNGLSQLNTHPSGFDRLGIELDKKGQDPGYKCVMEDREGKIWVGSWGNGIYIYELNTGKTERLRHETNNPQSLANDMVWDILEDRQGAIWIATHGGLQRYDPKQARFETFGAKDGLQHEAIRSLCEDDQGVLWIGTFGGLHRRDSDTSSIRFVEGYSSNPYAIINEIFADSHNQLWVAAFGQGVHTLDLATQQWTFYSYKRDIPNGLGSNIVLDIVEDAQSQIWLATQGGGLNQWMPHPTIPDSVTFRHWRPYNSDLPTESIFNLASDSSGKLWLSTDVGLVSFDIKTERIKPHSLPARTKGLIVETDPGLQDVFCVGNAENIYRFLPNDIHKNTHIPAVFITDIQIQDKSVPVRHTIGDSLSIPSPLLQSAPYASSLSLTYDQRNLTFVFTALNYIEATRNQYAYQLQGYDEDWIATDAHHRSARYTNLAPGSYTFWVKAANNEHIWNEEGASIHLDILPPWWRTWWAYVAYALIAFFMIRAFYLFQLKRKLAQAEAAKFKELDAAKSRLITNVTHEFRTPLTVILGMAQQIQDNPTRWLPDGIDAINRNGQQVLALVNQMLDLSRLEAGNVPVEYKQGNIMAYLGYLVESFQSYAATKEVTLTLTRQSEIIQMDFAPELLAKVVNNLISNAIKFTPEKGEVEISIQAIDDHLEINVKDNGIGISATNLPHIFDRFFQVDTSITRGGEGTGIGLALVKELVNHMQGSIKVESMPGIRTTFQVLLPITKRAPQWSGEYQTPSFDHMPTSSSVSVQSSANKDAPLVLIIEDNADVANYTASCLQKDYRILFAENGRIGIEKATEQVPDMIICDVMMPELDGYEVCNILKTDERTSHIPIIMLTAKVDDASRIKGLREGAEAYLAKPFNREELEVRLATLITIRKNLQKKFATFPQVSETKAVQAPQEDAFLQKLKKLVHTHIDEEDYGITALCLDMAVSRTQLHRKLKALTGRPTSHVIRSIRLQKAKELLLQSDLNISEIAFQTGFGNHSYFSSLFSEEFSQTPTEIRENHDLEQ